MAFVRKERDLGKRFNDPFILAQYAVPYTISSDSFYKHIDELKLADGKIIKATLGPTDMSVIPYDGFELTVVTDNRIDIIATQHYGKASLWRAIAYMNNISDPLKLKQGQLLAIPNINGLRKFPNPLG
jgi:hypothetical protein